MAERTAAEVLAEKIQAIYAADPSSASRGEYIAARLAEDPAVTVRTELAVDRYVLEIHRHPDHYAQRSPWDIFRTLTSPGNGFADTPDHRIVVRPYPEATDA
jgi:hypothetical protein